MLTDLQRAKIVITNYHAFQLRERLEIAKGTRSLLQGHGEPLNTLETEGQMIQRAMGEPMGLKNILVLNDEAYHCYRHNVEANDEEDELLKGDEKQEAQQRNEEARIWISGLEAVKRKLGIARVIDLSATPFFLRGSGYAEGTLFPWAVVSLVHELQRQRTGKLIFFRVRIAYKTMLRLVLSPDIMQSLSFSLFRGNTPGLSLVITGQRSPTSEFLTATGCPLSEAAGRARTIFRCCRYKTHFPPALA